MSTLTTSLGSVTKVLDGDELVFLLLVVVLFPELLSVVVTFDIVEFLVFSPGVELCWSLVQPAVGRIMPIIMDEKCLLFIPIESI
ncbi:hypothetical protein [Haloferax mediterranei]|uniref:hypothetical protein n=1 Tax=Haloferax mediterranei TaxID=2252 RepID=UPI0014613A66|nr:hypothetical protein [Haloferax mediterranei]